MCVKCIFETLLLEILFLSRPLSPKFQCPQTE